MEIALIFAGATFIIGIFQYYNNVDDFSSFCESLLIHVILTAVMFGIGFLFAKFIWPFFDTWILWWVSFLENN